MHSSGSRSSSQPSGDLSARFQALLEPLREHPLHVPVGGDAGIAFRQQDRHPTLRRRQPQGRGHLSGIDTMRAPRLDNLVRLCFDDCWTVASLLVSQAPRARVRRCACRRRSEALVAALRLDVRARWLRGWRGLACGGGVMALPREPLLPVLASADTALCYVATHRETGARYVGITRRTLAERKSQHERAAAADRTNGPFPEALRRCGPGAFTWQVVAEGEEQAIKLLEAALIAALGTTSLGGLNAVVGRRLGGPGRPHSAGSNDRRENGRFFDAGVDGFLLGASHTSPQRFRPPVAGSRPVPVGSRPIGRDNYFRET